MANGFFYNGSTSTIEITGSLNAQTFGVTGSLQGTSSYANSALSASYAPAALTDVSTYLSSSWTGSYNTGSWLGTASYANQALSASYAPPTLTDVSTYLSSSWTGSNTSYFAGTASYLEVTGSDVLVNWNGSTLQLTASVATPTLQAVTDAGNQTTNDIGITGSIFTDEIGIWNQSAVTVDLSSGTPVLDLVQGTLGNVKRYTDINFVGVNYALPGPTSEIGGNKTLELYNVDLNIPTRFTLDFYNNNQTVGNVNITFNVYSDAGSTSLNATLDPLAGGPIPTSPQNNSGYIKAITFSPVNDIINGLTLVPIGTATAYTLDVEIKGGFMNCKLYGYV